MTELLWILIPAIAILLLVLKSLKLKQITIFEYQRGLQYRRGRYAGTLEPGQYWISARFSSIVPVDIRPEFITIQGQEVLSSDGVALKASLAVEFQVLDPNVAINKNANYHGSLYLSLQMALREIIGKEKIEALLESRANIGAKLVDLTSAKVSDLGLKLISADVKDIMLPGEMKKAFAQVVKAQKDGQAALERARGETAALRNLANAARTIDENPNLLNLRALQAVAESSGSKLVIKMPDGAGSPVRGSENGNIKPQE